MTLSEYRAYIDEQVQLAKAALTKAADKAIALLEKERKAILEEKLRNRQKAIEQLNDEAIRSFEADMARLQEERQKTTNPILLEFVTMREEGAKKMLAAELARNKRLFDKFIK